MTELIEKLKDWDSFSAISEVRKPAGYENRLKETIDLIYNTKGAAPHVHEFLMREAMTTSDFPLLFGDVLDRQVLAAYKGVVPVWKRFTRQGTVNRIFPQIGGRRFAMTGGDQFLAEVPQKSEYPESTRTEAQYNVFVRKYGRKFDISWETIINDDLGALQDTPARFALAAVRTEQRLVTALYANDVGTHATPNLYENAINEDVLPLTIANLEICRTRMSSFVDAGGEPILNTPKYLVVGPSLELVARQILTSATKMWLETTTAAGVGGQTAYPITNTASMLGLELVVDAYLPILDPTHPGSWYLFSDPGDIAAIECDFLRGHERPEICMKASDKVGISGGSVSPLDGDFDSDNILYRVREVFGANRLDWRATYANIHA
jgi:hypothetical protein